VHGEKCFVITLSEGPSSIKSENGSLVLRISRNQNKFIRFLLATSAIFTLSIVVKKFVVNGLYEEFGLVNCLTRRKAIIKIVGDPIWERYKNKASGKCTINEFNEKKLNGKLLLQRKLLNFSLNQAQLIVTPGRDLMKLVEKWGISTKIIYIPNGVNTGNPRSCNRNEKALVISRLVSWKNIDKAIIACINSNLPLDIFGEGPEESKLRVLIGENNKIVSIHRPISHEEALNKMQEYKYFILLSEYEGQSFALLEAMSKGCIVLVSNIDANTEVVKDQINGVVVPIEDQNVINRTMHLIIENKKIHPLISKNAVECIEKDHNIFTICEKYRLILSDI
jgi:glycosyltransferase involved in cell wall biosynthesis